jgi:hypothetical protein
MRNTVRLTIDADLSDLRVSLEDGVAFVTVPIGERDIALLNRVAERELERRDG